MLLRLETVHLDRHFCRRDEIRHEYEAPAPQLRPIAEVEVLRQRVVLPPSGVVDRHTAPDTSGAIEVEEPSAAVAATVFQDEMSIEENRLDLGEQRVILIDMAPARLHHRDASIAEVRHQPGQEISRRNEVSVKN